MKKLNTPQISIHGGFWYGTKNPCFCIDYRVGHSGCGWGLNSLQEAFDALERLANRDGFTIEQCSWSKFSDYTLSDRPNQLEQLCFNF
jgi:hypothetical protein